MNLVEVDRLLPHLRQWVTGPLDTWMTDALLKAAVSFCRESELITLMRNVGAMAAGQTVTISNSYDLAALRVLSVTAGDDALSQGGGYTINAPGTITADRALTDVRVHYIAIPSADTDVIPEPLVTLYPDAVAAGAAYLLCMQPGRSWSDPQRAAHFHTEMKEGVRQAYRAKQEQSTDAQLSFRNPIRRHQFF